MRVLLDTHVLLWAQSEPGRLREATRRNLDPRANRVLFSAISLLEIAVKTARGRPGFQVRPERVLQTALAMGFEELPVHASMTLPVAELPPIHGDPFDRLLLAQAIATECRLYTADSALLSYGEPAFPA